MDRLLKASIVLVPVVVASAATPLPAQSSAPLPPQVVTVGRGDVDVRPDRARMQITVETRAASAATASAENARRQRAVLDTLLKLGIADAQIRTANLQVTPEVVYPGQGQAPRVTGYTARNSVRVDVVRLDLAGALVDAALARGASEVSGLQLYSSQYAELRREALAKAVAASRADAAAMARAAGYEIGQLLEMTAGAPGDGSVMLGMDSMRLRGGLQLAAAPPPISPGEITISETVTVRWAVKQ